ncbi:unnamed protein product [Dovyalis caffra]|uniref:Glutamyl/glutaminyl-tRNA synthetase class Ib catalytic domain-containing protein n=1 Tax=Dovyalis caffra TaxID=77055 RepID=A0AAV1RVP7_9ROSI|nr:unnamed protein product [Dovyalis caffra]
MGGGGAEALDVTSYVGRCAILVSQCSDVLNEAISTYVGKWAQESLQLLNQKGNRSNSVEENLKLWKEMSAGSERGLQCCVRGKLDMQDPNKSLRDPQTSSSLVHIYARFPTVLGIVRRGLTIEALVQFILDQLTRRLFEHEKFEAWRDIAAGEEGLL